MIAERAFPGEAIATHGAATGRAVYGSTIQYESCCCWRFNRTGTDSLIDVLKRGIVHDRQFDRF